MDEQFLTWFNKAFGERPKAKLKESYAEKHFLYPYSVVVEFKNKSVTLDNVRQEAEKYIFSKTKYPVVVSDVISFQILPTQHKPIQGLISAPFAPLH